MTIQKLNDLVAAAAPIHGVAMGDPADRTTWRIDFRADASDAARAAAEAVLAAFDPAAPEPRSATAKQLRYALNAGGKRAAWDAALASVSADTRDYWNVEPNPPENSAKLRRIADRAGVDLAALYDRALTL